ncbi:MAG: response regulator, partial [Desulfovibrio sp.]|nr:response regulator [Desulfovibrio sp.]
MRLFDTILQVICLVSCLFLIGILLREKVIDLLNSSLEHSVADKAADLAIMAEERFEREFVSLRLAAEYLEPYTEQQRQKFFEIREKDLVKGVSIGLFRLDGTPLWGERVNEQNFPNFFKAKRGKDLLEYSPRQGLIFVVPIFHKGNVQGITSRLYANFLLRPLFGLNDYSQDYHLLIQDYAGNVVVSYESYGEAEQKFFQNPYIKDGLRNIYEELKSNKSFSVYVEGEAGKFFLFGADLPKFNMKLVGYLPWSQVAGSISHIHGMLEKVGILTLLLFAVVSILFLTMQAKAEQSEVLARDKKLAEKANKAKTIFLASMSHEIRTPINAIVGMNEMILREATNKNVLNYATTIEKACATLLSLINDILDFSRIESGNVHIQNAPYNLGDLLCSSVNLIKPRLDQKNLAFSLEVDEKIPCKLEGDAMRLKQILTNLLTNALKYTEQGKVGLHVSFEKLGPDQGLLHMAVSDTGLGIRLRDQAKLFVGFARLDQERNRNIEGTGLGLAITHDLVKRMAGKIDVNSVYGEGSTFSVHIPQKVLDQAPVGRIWDLLSKEETRSHRAFSFTAPTARLLLVDDNEINLLVVVNLLKDTCLEMVTAQSGSRALDLLAKQSFDLVLLDLMMPGMDGVETLKQVRAKALAPKTPFVAFTANVVSATRESLLAKGFADYLTKPVQAKDLENLLLSFLPKSKVQLKLADVAPNALESKAKTLLESKGGENKGKTLVESKESEAYPLFNEELGLRYSGNSKAGLKEIAKAFAALYPEKKAKFEACLSQKDLVNYRILAHALKSSALALGAERLSALAKAVESNLSQYLEAEPSQDLQDEAFAKFLS